MTATQFRKIRFYLNTGFYAYAVTLLLMAAVKHEYIEAGFIVLMLLLNAFFNHCYNRKNRVYYKIKKLADKYCSKCKLEI